jgi:hypothetical protein
MAQGQQPAHSRHPAAAKGWHLPPVQFPRHSAALPWLPYPLTKALPLDMNLTVRPATMMTLGTAIRAKCRSNSVPTSVMPGGNSASGN